MEIPTTMQLIVDGEDVVLASRERWAEIPSPSNSTFPIFQGATKALTIRAVNSSAGAFTTWSKMTPVKRRKLLLKLAEVVRNRAGVIMQLFDKEVHSGRLWADIVTNDSICVIEECAALTGVNNVVSLLVDKGAPLNATMHQDGRTLIRFWPMSLGTLHIAAELGKTDAVRHLVNLGADTSVKDANGHTVVEWAQKLNQMEVVRLLESKL